MKKILIIIAMIALPAMASAHSLEIYPTIHNSHGGTKYSSDITVYTTIQGVQFHDTGVPIYDVPPGGTYDIEVMPPVGYSDTLSGDCSGIADNTDTALQCNVDYYDGAPIADNQAAPAPVFAVSAPQTIESNIANLSTTTNSDDLQALRATIIGLLEQIINLLTQQLATAQK